MADLNYIFPSKEAIFNMYKFLKHFETSIAQNAGKYDYDSHEFQCFLQDSNLVIIPVSKSKYVKDLPRNNYIVFVYGDHKTPYDDKAHDLLRHIRNSIGHALIRKAAKNKSIFDIMDRNKNGVITMRGNIDESLFFSLIEQLIKTYKEI